MIKFLLSAFLLWSYVATEAFAVAEPAYLAHLIFKDRTGTAIPDVLVYSEKPGQKPPGKAVIDQKNKSFTPFVIAISPGSEVTFPNSDNTRHHVYSFSDAKPFELKLYRTNEAPPVTFEKPGVVRLGCNIHDNMKAYVVVTSHQVYGISNPDGMATIEISDDKIPTNVTVWHPQLNEPQMLALPTYDHQTVELVTHLPMDWEQPQQAKSTSELENLLKQFKSRNH